MKKTKKDKIVIVGGVKLNGLWRGDVYSIFHKFPHIIISFLKDKDARKLILEPIEKELNISGKVVERILKITGCQPLLVQLVCDEIIQKVNFTNDFSITIDDVDQIIQRTISKLSIDGVETENQAYNYFTILWNGIMPEIKDKLSYPYKNIIISFLASIELGTLEQIEAKLKEDNIFIPKLRDELQILCDLYIITCQNSVYSFTIDFFKYWINSTHNYSVEKSEWTRNRKEKDFELKLIESFDDSWKIILNNQHIADLLISTEYEINELIQRNQKNYREQCIHYIDVLETFLKLYIFETLRKMVDKDKVTQIINFEKVNNRGNPHFRLYLECQGDSLELGPMYHALLFNKELKKVITELPFESSLKGYFLTGTITHISKYLGPEKTDEIFDRMDSNKSSLFWEDVLCKTTNELYDADFINTLIILTRLRNYLAHDVSKEATRNTIMKLRDILIYKNKIYRKILDFSLVLGNVKK